MTEGRVRGRVQRRVQWRLRGIAAGYAMALACAGMAAGEAAAQPPVSLQETADTFVLDNGIVQAQVSRASGDIVSLVYHGIEMLAEPPSGHPYGYWSHDARSTRQQVSVTIDPAANGGERAEVSIKGFYDGTPLGRGPGGGFAADIEIRYAIGRGDSGVYTYSIFEHRPEYPSAVLGEARFAAKLTDAFDWMLVDERHNFHISAMQRPDYNKYNYTTVQFDNPAYGFAGTQTGVGLFFVHPSLEYMTGPPTKVEFLGHAHNTLLAYWRSSHYGGGTVDVAAGEHWTKVIGPFLLYATSGDTPQAMWDDAKAQQRLEAQKWPYDWVRGVDYPHQAERATVKGRLVVTDAGKGPLPLRNLRVGLAHPPYTVPTGRAAAQNAPANVDWDTDSKHYSFWVVGDDDGAFEIEDVRPGLYVLHAFADGVLGHFRRAEVVVRPGETLDLGALDWALERYGETVWEIGEINRSGIEFAMGAEHAQNGLDRVYAERFPEGVHYIVGTSDYRTDWFFRHAPHPAGAEHTPWSVTFDLPEAPRHDGVLRMAFAGKQSRSVDVAVNGTHAGTAGDLWFDSSLGRNQVRGLWALRDVVIPAGLLARGSNTITLSFSGGGVIYDYLRFELATADPVAAGARNR